MCYESVGIKEPKGDFLALQTHILDQTYRYYVYPKLSG